MNIQQFVEFGLKRQIPDLLINRGMQLEIGPGENPCIEATDFLDLPGWNADLDEIPFQDDFFDVVHAYHILEHVHYPIDLLREIERVLKPGGHANIVVPYALADLAHGDLDHKHTFTEETWKNTFTNKGYTKHRTRPWQFKVHANFLCGVTFRNLCVFTQLQKVDQ